MELLATNTTTITMSRREKEKESSSDSGINNKDKEGAGHTPHSPHSGTPAVSPIPSNPNIAQKAEGAGLAPPPQPEARTPRPGGEKGECLNLKASLSPPDLSLISSLSLKDFQKKVYMLTIYHYYHLTHITITVVLA